MWLKPVLEYIIIGYSSICKDRINGNGGECAMFIRHGIQYRQISTIQELEVMVIEVWITKRSIKIINYYNPCKQLEKEKLESILEHWRGNVIWFGDFNAHSTLWGNQDDSNGGVIEEIMDEKELVCLNDGSGTRVNLVRGTESSIDLTVASQSIAGISSWNVLKEDTIGSDHYPISINIGIEGTIEQNEGEGRRKYEEADWNKFKIVSEGKLKGVNLKSIS